MYIAALFTIANLWKWPRCSTIDEWTENEIELVEWLKW
jgi:hypothetical protein